MAIPLAQTKSFKPAFARLLASFFGSAAPTASEAPLPSNQSPAKPGVKQQATVVASDTPANHNTATVEPNSLAQIILPSQTYEFSTNSWTAPLLEQNAASSDTTAVQQGFVRAGVLSVPESAFSRIQGTATATGTALEAVYTTTAPMTGNPSLLPAQASSGASTETPSVISSSQPELDSNAAAPMAPKAQGSWSAPALTESQAFEGYEQVPSTVSVRTPSVPADRSIATPNSAALEAPEPRAIPFGHPGSTSADSFLAADSISLGAAKQGAATPSRNIGFENPAPKSSPYTSADPVSGVANKGSMSLPLDSPSSTGTPPSSVDAYPTTSAAEFRQLLSNLADQVSPVIISHTLRDVIPGLTEEYGIRTSQPATSEPLPNPAPANITLSSAPAPQSQSAVAEPPRQDNGGSTVDTADPSSLFATGTPRSTASSSQLQSGVRGSNRPAQKATTAETVTTPSDQLTARTNSPTTTGAQPASLDAAGPASSDPAQLDWKLPVSISPAVFISEHPPAKDSNALASGAETSSVQQSSSQANPSPSADSSRASNNAKYSSAAGGTSPNALMSDLAAVAQTTSTGAFTPRAEPVASISTPPNTTSGGSNEARALASVVADRAEEPVELSPAMQAWNGGEIPSRLVQAARLGGNLRDAEMNIAMQSESLGAVDMHARVTGDVVGATIGVERHDAHAVISNDLYALHQALEERQLRVGNVTVVQNGSITSDTTANDGERPRQQRSANPPVPFEGNSNSGQPAVPSAAVETVESLAMRMIFDSQGRLSVRA